MQNFKKNTETLKIVEGFAAHRADDDLDDQPGLCRGALKRPESGYGV